MKLLEFPGTLVNLDQVILIEKTFFKRNGIRFVFKDQVRCLYFDSLEERDRVYDGIRNLYEIKF